MRNKEKHYLYNKNWKLRNKDKVKAASKRDYTKNKDRWKRYYSEHPRHLNKVYWEMNKEKTRNWHRVNRHKVLMHYSKGTLVCGHCGFSDIRGLCLDHINDDGTEDRKMWGSGGRLYNNIIKNGYPSKYQVLCANCNQIKEHIRVKAKLEK